MASQFLKSDELQLLEKQMEHNKQLKAQIMKLQNESEQVKTELDALQHKIKRLATDVISLQYLAPLVAVEKVQARKQLVLVEGNQGILPLQARMESILIETAKEGKTVMQGQADEEAEATQVKQLG
ncbi:hypothetical protein MKX08_009258 [Trichoderma sp. CBMAI-0020]|nr:hypothetical protein MKX08_009258 [Trichoderma sp. CBMAI-0020]